MVMDDPALTGLQREIAAFPADGIEIGDVRFLQIVHRITMLILS